MSVTEIGLDSRPPDRFRELVGERYAEIEPVVERARIELEGRAIWHVNSTARGGGVAEILHSYLAYVRGAGIDARWAVLTGNPPFFEVTKRLHNHLHGYPGDGGELAGVEREIYDSTLREATEELGDLVREGDIVFLHDPQTAGMARPARDLGGLVIWRCHVGTDRPNELVRRAWDFLRPKVEAAHALVFSRKRFVWDGLEGDRIWIMPPTIDAFSAKNECMDDETIASVLGTIGLATNRARFPPVFHRNDGTPARVNRTATIVQEDRLPVDVKVLTQVSRWDRLKDPVGLLACFAEHVRDKEAHLVLAGPDADAVDDDPEGVEVLAEVRERLEQQPASVRRRVHVVSLPMDDPEENAAMVNAVQRRADVIVQKSIAEGFGLTVAEAMWKEKPVVAGRIGGIQDQIVDGESGILVGDPRNLAAVGAAIDSLLSDPKRAARIGRAARERVIGEFLQIRRLLEYFEHIHELVQSESPDRPVRR